MTYRSRRSSNEDIGALAVGWITGFRHGGCVNWVVETRRRCGTSCLWAGRMKRKKFLGGLGGRFLSTLTLTRYFPEGVA